MSGPLASTAAKNRPGADQRSKQSRGPDKALLARCRSGWSLPGEFYRDEQIYRLDLERIWRTGWLFAGHACEIRKPGDYFTLDVDSTSIIVIRGHDGAPHGLHNVCRHRGSLICTQRCGHLARLICPYHQWTYGLDGRLLACRGMQSDLDKSQFGLRPVQVQEIEGLLFICLAEKAVSFASVFSGRRGTGNAPAENTSGSSTRA